MGKTKLVSCTLADGTYVGQFVSEEYAYEWLAARGHDIKTCTVVPSSKETQAKRSER